MKRLLIAATAIGSLSGCVVNHGYNWGSYESNLYAHYKEPARRDQIIQQMSEDLQDAEAMGRVPPGLYAEFGYLSMETGNAKKAIYYYNKEKTLWPESAHFMDTLIKAAQGQTAAIKTSSSQGATQ